MNVLINDGDGSIQRGFRDSGIHFDLVFDHAPRPLPDALLVRPIKIDQEDLLTVVRKTWPRSLVDLCVMGPSRDPAELISSMEPRHCVAICEAPMDFPLMRWQLYNRYEIFDSDVEAADYGAPRRQRYHVVAGRQAIVPGGGSVHWPEPTHAKESQQTRITMGGASGTPLPWVDAKRCGPKTKRLVPVELARAIAHPIYSMIYGFFRAAGDCLCSTCHKEYRRHPIDAREAEKGMVLHTLCNGSRVKL